MAALVFASLKNFDLRASFAYAQPAATVLTLCPARSDARQHVLGSASALLFLSRSAPFRQAGSSESCAMTETAP